MTEELKLPDQETYTRGELAKRWKCEPSKIDAYIRTGQLKEALPPTARNHFFQYYFYKCSHSEPLSDAVRPPAADDGYKWLLMVIEEGEPLEKYVRVAGEKIIQRKYLYLPPEDEEDAVIERPTSKLIRYFYDLEGNALIPVAEDDGWPICFAPVDKHHFNSLIIPLEEVKRFESESRMVKRGRKPGSVIGPKGGIQVSEDSDVPSPPPQTADKASNVPPDEDKLLDIKAVKKRVGWQVSTIHRKVSEGLFPQKQKRGKSTFWLESEINAYVAGTWKPTDEDGKANE